MRSFKLVSYTFIFLILTIFTQVGGLIFLLSLTFHKLINRIINKKLSRSVVKIVTFIFLYLLLTFTLVPFLAEWTGRVPLPVKETDSLRPLTFITFLLNRHYVRPELKEVALKTASEMNSRYPGTITNYLDGNFPFIDRFPLFPHLSHNDGKKLDLSFFYLDRSSGKPTNENPSLIGYGVCEEAKRGETNTAELCSEKGYWQYSLLKTIIPQHNKKKFVFDSMRTKTLIVLYSEEESIGKIFIEPHLKTRLKLNGDKIRFHGCQAVRHDDHIHVQLK